jgi:hypothetical protein
MTAEGNRPPRGGLDPKGRNRLVALGIAIRKRLSAVAGAVFQYSSVVEDTSQGPIGEAR